MTGEPSLHSFIPVKAISI